MLKRNKTGRIQAFTAILFLLLTAGALAAGGCSILPWYKSRQNIENSKQLRVGMTKQEVLSVMGEPESEEEYNKPDLWFYYVEMVWMDGLTTEDECMPLVFNGDKLVGWGRNFYTRYRLDQVGTKLPESKR